jgi:hypothetical protein
VVQKFSEGWDSMVKYSAFAIGSVLKYIFVNENFSGTYEESAVSPRFE